MRTDLSQKKKLKKSLDKRQNICYNKVKIKERESKPLRKKWLERK